MVGAYRQTNNQPQGMADYKDKTYTLGAAAPVGAAGVVKASYNRYERHNMASLDAQKADQFAWAMSTTCPSAPRCTARTPT